MAVEEILLSELNKRKDERQKKLDEMDKIYSERLKKSQELDESIKKQDEQSKQLELKMDTLIEKEKELFSKDYIIKTEDKNYDLIRKEDISFIDDKTKLTKEVLDVLRD